MSGTTPASPAITDSKYPFLIRSDVATCVAAAVESYIYSGKVDAKSVAMYGLVGVVSRYIENFIAKQNVNQKFMSNDYREQKNQLIVFTLNYLLANHKTNPWSHGLKGVNADLIGSWMVGAMWEEKPLFEM